MAYHHRIALALAAGAVILPLLGLRMKERKLLCHVGSLACCGLAILDYLVYAWIMSRTDDRFALLWLAHDLKFALPLLMVTTLLVNGFCFMRQEWRGRLARIAAKIWLPVLGVLLFAAFLMTFADSHGRIYVEGTAYEYCMDQAEPVGERQVILDVTSTREFLGRDTYYRGTLYVEGRGTEEVNLSRFERHYGMIDPVIWGGSREVGTVEQPYRIFFSPDQQQFVLQYAVFQWEQTGEGAYSGVGGFDPETGRLLCSDAPSFAVMVEQCRELGLNLDTEETT